MPLSLCETGKNCSCLNFWLNFKECNIYFHTADLYSSASILTSWFIISKSFWQWLKIMIWLDDQLNGFQGQTFLQVAATTILKIVWCYFELRLFFAFSVKLMRIYLELICSRSKDIGYSLTLQTVSWIIQHLKHHFAVNKEIQEQFFQNHFHFPNPYQPFLEDNLGLWLKLLGKTMVSCKNQ